jgi:hypothetical protein
MKSEGRENPGLIHWKYMRRSKLRLEQLKDASLQAVVACPKLVFASTLDKHVPWTHKVAPGLHHRATFLKEAGSSIGGTDLIRIGMRQRSLAYFIANAVLGSPDLESSAEPVSSRTPSKPHITQSLRKDHIWKLPSRGIREAQQAISAFGTCIAQDGNGTIGEWHNVLGASFHAAGRNCPATRPQVYLIPNCASGLAATCSRDDQEFKGKTAVGWSLPISQSRHKRCHLGMRQSGMVRLITPSVAQLTRHACAWICLVAKLARDCWDNDSIDTLKYAPSRFLFCVPDGIEQTDDLAWPHFGDWPVSDMRQDVRLHSRDPLVAMFAIR